MWGILFLPLFKAWQLNSKYENVPEAAARVNSKVKWYCNKKKHILQSVLEIISLQHTHCSFWCFNSHHVPVWMSPEVTTHSALSLSHLPCQSRQTVWSIHNVREWTRKILCVPVSYSPYLKAPMLPTIMTAPMMPIRLYFGTVLESCLRITMCMSSWGDKRNRRWMSAIERMKRGGNKRKYWILLWMCTWMWDPCCCCPKASLLRRWKSLRICWGVRLSM